MTNKLEVKNIIKGKCIDILYRKNEQQENDSYKELFLLVQEYCKLSKLLEPSSEDIDRIAAILELAQYDRELNCLINEADHLIAHELGLCGDFEENHDRSITFRGK
jgi:hypothetical protein